MIVKTSDRVRLVSEVLRSPASPRKWFSNFIAGCPGSSQAGYLSVRCSGTELAVQGHAHRQVHGEANPVPNALIVQARGTSGISS